MNIIRSLIQGGVALAGFALSTPARADGHHPDHHGYYYPHHRIYTGVTVGNPGWYNYNPYPYTYPAYPYYGYEPGFSVQFGGGPYYYRHYHHYSHWHHR